MANLKSIKSQARIAEKIVTQESTDSDWGKVGETTLFFKPKEYFVLAGSNPSNIITAPNLSGKKLNLIMGDNSVIETTFTDPVKTIDTTQTLDILGDGSCIACYPLDGNANDLSGKYNGTWYTVDSKGNIVKGGEAYDTGKFGQAAKFNGNNSISVGDGNFLKIGTNPYSFSFWFKFNSIIDGENGFLGKYDGNDGSFTLEYLSTNKKFVGYSNSNTQIAFSDTLENPIETGVWYHIVFILEQDNYRCYLNGKLLPVTQTGYNFNVTNAVVPVIGGYKSDAGLINGLIDQVRIFNRALTDEEIQKLYYEQRAKYDISGLNLSLTPHRLFEAFETPKALVSLEATENDIVESLTEEILPVLEGSDNKNLITADLIPGEEIIVDSKDLEITEDKKLETTDTTQTLDILGDRSCIACYPLDGNANDLSGKYNGTWNGSEQYDTGKFGQAAKLQDSDIVLDKSVAEFKNKTISLWYKELDPNTSKLTGIYQEGITTDSPFNGLQLWSGYNDTNLVFRTKHGNEKIVCPLSELADDFHHICITYDMEQAKVYLDGELRLIIEETTDFSSLVQNVVLGGNYNNPDNQKLTNGLIDQVRIFNRALTDSEVQELYYEQKAKYDISELKLTDTPKSVIRKGYKEFRITNSSTTSVTFNIHKYYNINTGDKLLTDKGLIEVTNSSITTDTTQTLDILGDGSCIACYPLDGNANDLSGKYNGTWNGTEQYDVGMFDKAAKFNGNSYILLLNGDNSVFKTLNFTFTFWLRTDKPSNSNGWDGDQAIIGRMTPGSNSGDFEIKLDSNGHIMTMDGLRNNTDTYLHGNTIVTDNRWYFCACSLSIDTNSNLTVKIYVNGKLDAMDTYKKNKNMIDFEPRLGMRYGESNDYFTGLIDQVRIFNRALTDEEIQKIYKEESIKYNIEFNELPTPPTLIALLQKSQEQPIINTIFDGKKFVATYGDITKTGRAIQRKFIIPDNNIEILPPIVTKLYKLNS